MTILESVSLKDKYKWLARKKFNKIRTWDEELEIVRIEMARHNLKPADLVKLTDYHRTYITDILNGRQRERWPVLAAMKEAVFNYGKAYGEETKQADSE